ncbi:hypothetical protein [Alicyclobacillus acidiphilus]|uniref:hypothetical protein n=1 Tax=Alicyclobacillus acidiphilus TaxID=182455 RepID=UPI002480FEA3|nr:hypothetical protein [Alicyclobacillus acidiphilus]
MQQDGREDDGCNGETDQNRDHWRRGGRHDNGEHGDTEVPVWSTANVVGLPVDLAAETRDRIARQTRDAAYEVIQLKGYTSYAIALALDRICSAILYDERAILNVSTLLENHHGVADVYMGVPCVVGAGGIERVVEVPLSNHELRQFQESAKELRVRIETAVTTLTREESR